MWQMKRSDYCLHIASPLPWILDEGGKKRTIYIYVFSFTSPTLDDKYYEGEKMYDIRSFFKSSTLDDKFLR